MARSAGQRPHFGGSKNVAGAVVTHLGSTPTGGARAKPCDSVACPDSGLLAVTLEVPAATPVEGGRATHRVVLRESRWHAPGAGRRADSPWSAESRNP